MRVVSIFMCLIVCSLSIPVYVMLPLNTITNDGKLNSGLPFDQWFQQLSQAGVDGVMGDVWWGIVERSGPKQYDWSAYQQLVAKIRQYNLKFQATISFHQCGGNVGDECDITLPSWVLSVGNSNPDIFYTDQHGNRDKEYLSLGVDTQPIFSGRTPVQIYTDYVQSFVQNFGSYIGNTIVELQIGLGPAGELRYPSYQLSHWSFPGVGEFQCYDRYLLASLKQAASGAGHPEWGNGGPDNAGNYNCNPCQDQNCAPFFNNGFDNYASQYGQFFLTWYSQNLIAHGDRILGSISNVVRGYNVTLAAKVSGIHWQYKTASHGAELTAGYKNDKGDAYNQIAAMFSKYGVTFDFTCFEMRDSEQPGYACSGPEELVQQTLVSARSKGVHFAGENALPRYDQTAYNTIVYESTRVFVINAFTYLRLDGNLLSGGNWNNFVSFLQTMHSK
eukprot:TRINITY_DN8637_c0_g1_i1.p1 TRINITY_DN8637_c0_g1~~TRINITY_DN8637_c0_g1_i1.p1  ORF type:complete len:445 (-),score=89.28 TRINITY_DN8637_c0_g1_i1:135-1469(-)